MPEDRAPDAGITGAETERGHRLFPLLLAATVVLALLPILLARILPLGDYPNHLARFHILAHWGEQGWMRAFWRVAWEPLPNLGVDLIAVGLAKILPTLLAGRIAVAGIVLLHGFGFLLLAREWSGRFSAWGLLGFPFAYTFPLNMGFLNYQLGVALVLLGLATHLRARERTLGGYALPMIPLAAVTMLAHLQAFGILLVAIAAIEAGIGRSRERAPLSLGDVALRLLVLVPIPAIYYLLGSGRGELGGIAWATPGMKVNALLKVFYLGQVRLDLLVMGLFVVLLVAATLAGLRLARTGWTLLLVLFGVFLVLPDGFRATHFVDMRLPALMVLVALGFAVPAAHSAACRLPLRLAGAALALFVVGRLLVVANVYHRRGAELDLVEGAMTRLPASALVFTCLLDPDRLVLAPAWEPPLMHAAALSAIVNSDYPTELFVFPGQQPLTVRPELIETVQWDALAGDAGGRWADEIRRRCRTLPPEWRRRPVFALFARGDAPPPVVAGTVQTEQGPTWTVYRIDGI